MNRFDILDIDHEILLQIARKLNINVEQIYKEQTKKNLEKKGFRGFKK